MDERQRRKTGKTEWHRCVVWNTKGSGLADVVEKYCKKGDKLYVEGRIEYRQWQDKENQTRYTTEINVRELLMLGGGQGGGGRGADFDSASDNSRSRAPARSAVAAARAGRTTRTSRISRARSKTRTTTFRSQTALYGNSERERRRELRRRP